MLEALKSWLSLPATRGLDLDDPRTTALRREIIRSKGFLRRIYEEWYSAIADALPAGDAPVLELGSGGGFLSDHIPGLITSDLFPCPGVELIVDAHQLPFERGQLRGIVMTNVFHHVSRPRQFLNEAQRCVQTGGAVVMLEPWMTAWSQFVYTRLHHEPLDKTVADWEFTSTGPLSDANIALPWVVFQRDRAMFEAEFPEWRIKTLRPMMPMRYLLSGGVSLRSLMPGWSSGLWRAVESLASCWIDYLAMFALIVLVRTGSAAEARPRQGPRSPLQKGTGTSRNPVFEGVVSGRLGASGFTPAHRAR